MILFEKIKIKYITTKTKYYEVKKVQINKSASREINSFVCDDVDLLNQLGSKSTEVELSGGNS
jgi:hypothetical protein